MENPTQTLASYPSSLNALSSNDVDEIMEYVAFLENELEGMMLQASISTQKHHKEKTQSKKKNMKDSQMLKSFDDHTKSLAYDMKNDFIQTSHLREDELGREKVLEEKVHDLELQLELKNDLLDHRWRRHERAEEYLKKENAILKKKATLGWILGCLSEAYMSSKSEGGADPLLCMIRDILRDFDREATNLSLMNAPTEVKLEYVEKEIQRIIQGLTKSKTNNNSPPISNQRIKDKAKKDMRSCYIVTIKEGVSHSNEEKVGEYEVVEEASSDIDDTQKQEEGTTSKHETNESVQNEMKKILKRIEASMDILLQQHLQHDSTFEQFPQSTAIEPTPQSTIVEPTPQVLERSLGGLVGMLGSADRKTRKNKPNKPNSSQSKQASSKIKPFLLPGIN